MKKIFVKPVSDRRKFIKSLGYAVGSITFGLPALSLSAQSTALPHSSSLSVRPQQNRKLGIALVGLGEYSTNQLAPALQETENCYLSGIVTGTPSKAKRWKSKYNIPEKNIYNYQNFDQVADNPDIDIIYIVLPNGMHAEYTIRAAEAGKHVICEKPMATSVEDCQRMIDACNRNEVRLSIGYRLHFEPHNQRVMELGQEQVFGAVQQIQADDSMLIDSNPDQWRLNKELSGGGPLMDVGIYCVQGACYTMGQAPMAIKAQFGEVTRPEYFDDVEQSISWQMEFPGGTIAHCESSYNRDASLLYGEAENGWWRLNPAYSYSGIQGETSQGKMDYPQVNQQARQMDDFARCVLENRATPVPGEMGMRDVRILMAIYEAARTGERVSLSW